MILMAHDEKMDNKDKKKAKAEKNKAKKAANAQKAAKKRRKALVPRGERPVLCPPEAADRSGASEVLGIVCRAAVLFFAVFGMCFLLFDALGFFDEEEGAVSCFFLALVSLVLTALFTLCSLQKTKKIALPATLALIGGGAVWLSTGARAVYVVRAVINGVVKRLYARGFLSAINYAQPEEYGSLTLHGAMTAAAAIIAAIYAAAYVPFLIRRTRIAVPAAVSVLTLVPVFVYNLTRSNWGVAMVIASFAGVLVMCVYDRMYQKKPDPDEFDTETCVIEVEGTVEAPDELTSREQRRLDRKNARRAAKAAKKAKKAEKRRIRGGKAQVNADEDISDYFSASKKPPRAKREKKRGKRVRLTKEQRMAKKAEKKSRRAAERLRDRDIRAARRRAAASSRAVSSFRASSGGFAGAVMLLIAFAILLVPAAATHENFRLIESINNSMDYYREYVTALLMGDDPLLDELYYQGSDDSFRPRSTEAEHISFTGKKLMEVGAASTVPIYLRGWVATDYDNESDAWVTATPDSDTFKNYRHDFGTTIDPGESMFYGLYNYIAPDTVADIAYENSRLINNTSKYGFIAMQVNMKRTDLSSNLVYMPSFTNRRYNGFITTSGKKQTYAMRAYGSAEASKLTYTDYFDGIYTGYKFAKDTDGYASVAYVTSMKNSGFYRNLAAAIAQFNSDRVLIEKDIAAVDAAAGLPPQLRTNAGYFRSELDEDGKKTVIRTTESSDLAHIVYTVEYDADSGRSIITVPVEEGWAIYTCETSTGKVISKDLERIPTREPGENVKYSTAPDMPALVRYLEFYTDAERSDLVDLWNMSDKYTQFVYNTYTGKSDSKIIGDLVAKIISEAHTETVDYTEDGIQTITIIPRDLSRAAERNFYKRSKLEIPVTDAVVFEQRHQLVMGFVKWLKDNCTYTLTPTLSDDTTYDGVEKFLTVTHEGYCVQFASALALMLREAGIPARYVEGYIASDFYRRGGSLDYVADVRDSNAHAWVEVFFEGIGWVQYEATPEYYQAMYEYRQDDPLPVTPVRPGRDDEEDDGTDNSGLSDEELEKLLEEQRAEARRKLIIKIVTVSAIVLAVAAVLAAVFAAIRRRADRKAAARTATVKKLGSEKGGETNAALNALVRDCSDMLTVLLSECGCAPQKGEFRDAYAARLYAELGALLSAPSETETSDHRTGVHGPVTERELAGDLDAIAAVEFGGDVAVLPSGAPAALARLWFRLYENAYRHRVPAHRRFFLYYFRQVL